MFCASILSNIPFQNLYFECLWRHSRKLKQIRACFVNCKQSANFTCVSWNPKIYFDIKYR